MQFSAGQVVVHPHHGPATITEITTRILRGVPTNYLSLQVHRTNLVVAVPMDKVDEVGVRAVFDRGQIESLFEVLQAASGQEEEQWSRRQKANHEKLLTGDLFAAAGVVRDLTRRLDTKGLSWGEKDMLRDARKPLLAEIALSLDLSDDEAVAALDAAIVGEPAPQRDLVAVAG
ncbi:CarD family transcriptional regulator [Georgenia yuyongxinii]|nr:CarD family transcriptional regulator [Georgenia yuyongxinii]